MKWTRFKQEFENEGILYKYGGINNLEQDPITNLWVSIDHNPNIDKCFRIYTDPDSLYKLMPPSTKNPELYRVWVHHDNEDKEYDKLPREYFNKYYFKLNRIYGNKKIYREGNFPEDERGKPVEKYFGLDHPYEIFIGGWVHFYDEEVRHGETDHAIYFDWDLDNESVTIYIYQTKQNIKKPYYVKVYPPSSQDPPPPKNPPPPCAQP